MPPKKRGRAASKASDPVVDDNVSASKDLVAPPKKRGRPPKPKQVPDAEAASEDDYAPPPAKKARGRLEKTPVVVVDLNDEEPEPQQPKPTKAKQPAKGKNAAAKAVASDDEPAVGPGKKANSKQIAKDKDDDEQDVKPVMSNQLSLIHHSLDTWPNSVMIVVKRRATVRRDARANHDFQMLSKQKPRIFSRDRSRNSTTTPRLLAPSIWLFLWTNMPTNTQVSIH